jgi:hypothetical protein
MASRVMFYQALIEKDLSEIKAEHEAGVSALTKLEYIALIAAYQDLLDSSNEAFFVHANNLTKLEHEMMVKRMSKALLMQYNKSQANKILTLALQMKQDFANVKHDFLNASNKIFKELKSHND